jgi:hypothetical protein
VLALIGFAGTFVTGAFLLKPIGDRIAATVERDGGTMGPEALAEARRLIILSRLDYVVLLIVVFDMVVKPTGDDAGALIVMGAALAAGVAYVVTRGREGRAAAATA